MTPFTITVTAAKNDLENALGKAVQDANLVEPALGQARVAGLGALRLAFALTMGIGDVMLHVELKGDGVNLGSTVGIS